MGCFRPFSASLVRHSLVKSLLLGAIIGSVFVPAASAQVVYDSTANPILPAAPLIPTPTANGIVGAVTDDYTTTLVGTGDLFALSSLTFYGGVEFTGPGDGINNVLRFRFLNAFGGIPTPVTSVDIAFATSGSFLQTIAFNDALIPTDGVIEVTTLANSGAVGTFAFSGSPASVGSNDPGRGPGVRAFSLSGRAAPIPEPGSMALLLGTGIGAIAAVVRRRSAK
jgi:hypothetical protein